MYRSPYSQFLLASDSFLRFDYSDGLYARSLDNMYDSFATSSYQMITGFSPDQLAAAATSTIATFGGGLIVTFATAAPYVAAALIMLTILGFTIVIIKVFMP